MSWMGGYNAAPLWHNNNYSEIQAWYGDNYVILDNIRNHSNNTHNNEKIKCFLISWDTLVPSDN